jgi:hypothetical protein
MLTAGAAAAFLVLGVAGPAFAGEASGFRSCPVPKSVTLSSTIQAAYGYHYYAASSDVQYIYNPNPAVAWFKQTYGSPAATNWIIWADGHLAYSNAGCY